VVVIAPALRRRALDTSMNKLVSWLGLTVGGWIGWAIGAPVSIFTAFVLSMVGTGAGLYVARRLIRDRF
jgi:hypothetical protein